MKPRDKQIRRINRKSVHCSRCGVLVAPGDGRVWRCWGSRSRYCKQHRTTDGGWHCSCLNEDECRKRSLERKRRTVAKQIEIEL